MIRADSEVQVICNSCNKPAFQREVFIVDQGLARRVTYETHQASIVDQKHIEALLRAQAFYNKGFAVINTFNKLPEKDRTIIVENPTAAGILIELTFGSVCPSACNIRTIIIPHFTLKTFGKEYDIKISHRHQNTTTLKELMDDIWPIAQGYIREAKERFDMGLY